MNAFFSLFALAIIVALYVGIVYAISYAVDGREGVKHKAFWWVFFFGLIGAIIVTLKNIRDK